MKDFKNIRQTVSQDYARAVNTGQGCCGQPVQKGVVAKIAGYTDDELASLPPEAVTNSFGCGNPLAFSAVQKGSVVLDLGSGAGIDILLAAKKVGPTGKVIGVDMTDEMISKAQENIAQAGLANVEVRKGLIESLPVDDSSVDWVISNCVINLSPEKHRVFAEIFRVLRPGGQFLVSDIVAENLPAEIAENPRLYSSCLSGAISEENYLKGLREAGLTELKIKDRFVYAQSQLVDFIGSELNDNSGGCCSGTGPDMTLAQKWAPRLVDKVASVKVFGRRPPL